MLFNETSFPCAGLTTSTDSSRSCPIVYAKPPLVSRPHTTSNNKSYINQSIPSTQDTASISPSNQSQPFSSIPLNDTTTSSCTFSPLNNTSLDSFSPTSVTQKDRSNITPAPANKHLMVTKEKAGIFIPKVLLAHSEPTSIAEDLEDKNWKHAMIEELQALQRNQTWTLVSLPPNRQAIGCKWVFRVKENSDGSIQRYKARLVAKGFNQKEGFDYHKTFSPVVKPISIRIILTLALTYGWKINQLDVHNAFLHGASEEEVFMRQPPGFEHTDKTLVCKLNRAFWP